jgi:hypothetical protein
MGMLKRLRRSIDAQVRGWRHRETRDVVLISYPKAGRTWVRFMLNHAGVPIEYSHSGAGNRLGLPFEQIKDRVHEWSDRRVIFLTRDPRDTLVSSYFQATKRIAEEARFQGSISEFLRHPGYGIEKIARFNLHWLESAPLFRDFTHLSYEAMHASTAPELARAVTFATGKPADQRRVVQACEAGRFDNMRKVEAAIAGAPEDKQTRLGGGAKEDPESLKTRKGKVGGWVDYLSPEDAAFGNEVLERIGYFEKLGTLAAL